LDVKTAFLNAVLPKEVEIYMRPPKGTDIPDGYLCRLRRSLYGLKQAPLLFYKVLTSFLTETLGFEGCETDRCMFVKRASSPDETGIYGDLEKGHGSRPVVAILVCFVDDILYITRSRGESDAIADAFKRRFECTDQGPDVKKYVGLEVNRRGDGAIHLGVASMVNELVKEYGLEKATPVSTPWDQRPSQRKPDEPSFDVARFRRLLGKLLWCGHLVRVDITAAVNCLGRYQADPAPRHWDQLLRIVKYLKGTAGLGLTYCKDVDPRRAVTLYGYSDAEHGGDKSDRRSVMAYVFMLCGGVLDFRSCRQTSISLSSTESEYVALSHATQQLGYLRRLLREVGLEQTSPSVLFEDNQSVLGIARDEYYAGRLKHIDLRHHFLRQEIERKVVQLNFCPSKELIADALTKPIGRMQFRYLRNQMGLGWKTESRLDGVPTWRCHDKWKQG
jgi:hypothetical protein